MGRVELLIDPLQISRQPIDIEVTDAVGARAARSNIRAHLIAASLDVIRLRMDRQAFRFLKDMEGLADLQVVYVSAKGELARKLRGTLPMWCTDEFIVIFYLLDKIFPANQEFLTLSIELQILYLLNPVLVTASSPEELLYAIRHIPVPIQLLVSSAEIKSHLESVLACKLEQAEIVLIFKMLQVDNFASQIDNIFREIVIEKIRTFVSRTGITFPIAPRQIPISLTKKLTLTSDWWSTIDVEKTVLSLTQRVIQIIEKGQLRTEEISIIIFGYIRAQLDLIMLALEAMPAIATSALLVTVRNFRRDDTLDIENAIQLQLQMTPPALLDINSSAKEAMDWAEGYLQYAANAFRRGNEPEELISQSFSDWVLAQPTRLLNQQWNWRAVSASVRRALEQEKIVVLLVVDAFGAILSNELVKQLRGINDTLHVEKNLLFAPLPTITEIGKLAVSTGKDVHKLTGNAESAIGSAYQHLLANPAEYQFIKGWTASAKIMEPSTRLLVFFENQLDDKLHECLHYIDLDAQLKIIHSKIIKWVSQWMLEAETRGKDIEIFITADHGLTKIATVQEFLQKEEIGSIGERFIKARNQNIPAPPGFYKISAEGAPESCYFIPRNRVRLIKKEQSFVHGGMTPEEMLIPLISVRPMPRDEVRPIKLQLQQPLAALSNDGWSVQLVLTSGSVALHGISIKTTSPFTGEYKLNLLSANESISFSLHLRAHVPQEGAVGIGFKVRFLTPGATIYTAIDLSLNVTLQPRVLIRGQGEIDFDNMFD